MRILFISNYSQLYGANRSMLTVIEHFKNKGHDVSLLLPQTGDICDILKQKDLHYKIIGCFTQLYYYKFQFKYLSLPFLWFYTYFKLPVIKKYVKKFKPDLIYSNTSAENIGIKIAKDLNIKHISHIREFMDLDYRAYYIGGAKSKKKYISQSDGVMYVSQSVAKHVNMDDKIPINHQVIYNGINTVNWDFECKYFNEELNLGVVGIFDFAKGQDTAIQLMPEILKLYPKAKLHLWGDKEGKYKKTLIRMVNDLHLKEHVIFHGFENNPNIIYSGMHVLLMCSRCEGFGRVTIEAMQRAIPVLGYNSGGTSELIKNGVNGYLFNDSNEFIDGLKKILSSNAEYNRIRKQAYDDSRSNFSIELYCSQVESFINKIFAK